MNVLPTTRDGVLCLRFEGEDALDYTCAGATRERAVGLVSGAGDVVIDLGAVEFIDSAGLGVLVSVFKAARRSGRRAVFAGARPGVRSVMRIIRLDLILELSGDVPAALAMLAQTPPAGAEVRRA